MSRNITLILVQPNQNAPFRLEDRCSSYATGAVLSNYVTTVNGIRRLHFKALIQPKGTTKSMTRNSLSHRASRNGDTSEGTKYTIEI